MVHCVGSPIWQVDQSGRHIAPCSLLSEPWVIAGGPPDAGHHAPWCAKITPVRRYRDPWT
jgi:hypothetical protein